MALYRELIGCSSGESVAMLVLAVLFWSSIALIVWTQLGYALALALLARLRRADRPAARAGASCRGCR